MVISWLGLSVGHYNKAQRQSPVPDVLDDERNGGVHVEDFLTLFLFTCSLSLICFIKLSAMVGSNVHNKQ